MSNRFFEPGEHRSEKVGQLFSRIAPQYDLLNDLMSLGLHRRWKRRLLALAELQEGQAALDICCGTGDLVFGLAQHGVQAVGLDFNAPMLEQAQARARRFTNGSPSLVPRFIQGDAQQLPFPDASFDVVTVGYGLRNLADWELGLSEMRRVARPGGRVLVLDFGKPDNPLWRSLYFAYLRLAVPCLGQIFCGSASAYAYILESLKNYPAQHGVAAKMKELGLNRIRIVNLLGGVMTINFGQR